MPLKKKFRPESIAKARIDIGKDDIDDAYMDVNYAISRDTNYTLKEFKKESMSTKQLLEAANRKCEMRWKVLAFNPDEDNKLVKEFKDFDCIDCAVAKKREYLEKNPTHIVEVISESKAQKNEDLSSKIKSLFKDKESEIDSTGKYNGRIKSLDNYSYAVWLRGNDAEYDSPVAKFLRTKGFTVDNKLHFLPFERGAKVYILESVQKNEATLKDGTKVKVVKGWYSGKTGTIAGTAEEYDPDTHRTTNYCYMVKIPGQGIIQIDRDNVVAESAQKNERHLFKKGDRVNALGNTGTIASVYYEDPAETRKRFKVLMDKNKKVEVFTEPELKFVESAQKNEVAPLQYVLYVNNDKSGKDNSYVYNDLNSAKRDALAYEKQGYKTRIASIFKESAQKNETSLRDLNLDLSEDTNAVIASADKIRQRFEYRTLQNQSYDEKQAEKIYLEVRRELEKAKKLIDACYNKIG